MTEAPGHAVGQTVIVHKDRFAYISHPSITILKNGDWLAAFNHSRRREKIMHPPDDPLYRTLLCRSRDRGRTWGSPGFAPDFEWHGTQCPGIACLRDGTTILTQFRYAWYPLELARKRKAAGEPIAICVSGQEWSEDFEDSAWSRSVNPWARGDRGLYAHFSRDGALTFEETVRIDCGPMRAGYSRTPVRELADGRLGYALCEPHAGAVRGRQATFFVASSDGGRSWSSPVTIAEERNDRYCEPDIEEVASGEILCVLRDSERHGLDICRSLDGGVTWSAPEQTSMSGLPGHLLKLADGRLLCAYGRRKTPFGIRMSLSEDGGRTWETGDEIVVREDLPNGDLGYPTTIEYEPGRLFVCYYGQEPDGVTCVQGTYVDLR